MLSFCEIPREKKERMSSGSRKNGGANRPNIRFNVNIEFYWTSKLHHTKSGQFSQNLCVWRHMDKSSSEIT